LGLKIIHKKMSKYQFLVIHCADTYPSFPLSKEVLEEWHKGPRDEANGTVVYLGKTYPNRSALPADLINFKPVNSLVGRGWDRLGYRDIIHRDGSTENITDFTDDDEITSAEMTWGQPGFNANGVHVCLEGGRISKPYAQPPMKGAEVILYTPDQLEALLNYVLIETANHPQIKVAGHYMLTNIKNCPNFDVAEWLKKIGRSEFCYKP
jgi:N-acetylmuramoyl-L-alanine amidase